MATVPETNRCLWDALDAVYARQRAAAEEALDALESLFANNPDVAHDAIARDAGRAAIERQKGFLRYAESQLALAEPMRGYWADRVDFVDQRLPFSAEVPLRRAIPANSAPTPARTALSTNVAE